MMRKILIVTLILGLSIPMITHAQTDKEQIQKVIRSFSSDASKLREEGYKVAEKLMGYTAPNFIYQHKSVNIMNFINRETFNREMVSHILHEMRGSDVKAVRKLGSLDNIYIREKLALALYEVDYELYEGDRLINKGHQWAEMFLRKNADGQWKIESLSVLNADETTFKSLCICEIYETKGLQSIITETIVPDGHEADILEDKFSVDESTQPRQVRHGFRDYLWNTNGAVHRRKIDGSEGEQLGIAGSRQELLLLLLKKEVYPDRCDNVIRKLR